MKNLNKFEIQSCNGGSVSSASVSAVYSMGKLLSAASGVMAGISGGYYLFKGRKGETALNIAMGAGSLFVTTQGAQQMIKMYNDKVAALKENNA